MFNRGDLTLLLLWAFSVTAINKPLKGAERTPIKKATDVKRGSTPEFSKDRHPQESKNPYFISGSSLRSCVQML